MSAPCRGTVPSEDGPKEYSSKGHFPMAAPREVVPGRAPMGSGSARGTGGIGRVGGQGTWREGKLDRGQHGLLQDRTQPLFLGNSEESFPFLP